MIPIIIPENYNYIAAFLSLHCNLHCSYCLNRHGGIFQSRKLMSGDEWVSAINRIESRPDLPVTLQGGEPTLHPDFYYIVNNIKPELKLNLLTNGSFDIYEFMEEISTDRFNSNASYASIRVSYHPEQVRDMVMFVGNIYTLHNNGYSIGIWSVDHPAYQDKIQAMRELCQHYGISFLAKDYLGFYNGKFYGQYKYPDSCGQEKTKRVSCRTTEFLISSDGKTYRCHADLYADRDSIGDVHDPNFQIEDIYRECNYFGQCNPCDTKLKWSRFGKWGWVSTDIKEIK